jgi:hypothetical protein
VKSTKNDFNVKQKINISKEIDLVELSEVNCLKNEITKNVSKTNYRFGAKFCNTKRRNGMILFETGNDDIKFKKAEKKLANCVIQEKQHVFPLNNQIKAAKQLAILLLAFIITWLPYFVSFMVIAFCSKCVPTEFMTITIWLGYINSACNPLLYALSNSSYKNSFKRMLKLKPNDRKRFIPIMNFKANY